MRPRVATLIPPAAFVTLLAVAALSSEAIRAKPLGQVYARTHAFAAALQSGDVEAVLAFQEPPATLQERAARVARIEQQLDRLRGRPYVVTSLEPGPDGSYAAQIRWIADVAGAGAWRLEIRWEQDAEGVWRLS